MTNEDLPVVDEIRWNAWLLKSKQRELRTQRKIKMAAALQLTIILVGAAGYLSMK